MRSDINAAGAVSSTHVTRLRPSSLEIRGEGSSQTGDAMQDAETYLCTPVQAMTKSDVRLVVLHF